jgi:hypothetical protein
MTAHVCHVVTGVLRRAPEPVYELCHAPLGWSPTLGEGLACPLHGPQRLAVQLAPVSPGSAVLEPVNVCDVPYHHSRIGAVTI